MRKLFLKFHATRILFIILFIVAVGGSFGLYSLFSEPRTNAAAESISYSDFATVLSDDEAPTFGEKPQTRWFAAAERIIYAMDDYYDKWSILPVRAYYEEESSGGATVSSYDVNEELFAVEGIDVNGLTRLEPVYTLASANNITATSYAQITVSQFRELYTTDGGDRMIISDDTRKLSELKGGLAIVGNDTEIGNGKILYRSSYESGAVWGSWNCIDLTSNITLTFTAPYNQLAVIYELREKNPSIWKPFDYYYHHLIAIYRFNVV